MVTRQVTRQILALWLSAILLVVSFASAGHTHKHLDDGSTTECTLCYQQHQFNKSLPSSGIAVPVQLQSFVPYLQKHNHFLQLTTTYYSSRAPPQTA